MAKYHVSYDLNDPGQNYEALKAELQSKGKSRKIQRSVWVVITSETCKQLFDRLKTHIDQNDDLFVTEISMWVGRQSKEDLEWLQNN